MRESDGGGERDDRPFDVVQIPKERRDYMELGSLVIEPEMEETELALNSQTNKRTNSDSDF